MTTRREIMAAARALAAAVADSAELSALQRCEAALGERRADLEAHVDEPEVQQYLAAREAAERLLQQVTSVFIFPLTGQLLQGDAAGAAGDDCGGCEHSRS